MDKSIEYILEVARCGGITKAANNLFITPSALSKFVQSKEGELQVKLFHRIGKKFKLTQAGECYVQTCKEIEVLQQELTTQMKRFSSMSHGEIRIGVQASFIDVMIQKIIPQFQTQFPGVKIILVEHTVGMLIQMLQNQQLDIVVSIIDKKETGLEYVKLHDCELVMAVASENPVMKQAVEKDGFLYPWIDLSDCEQQPHIMLLPGSPYRTYADNLYEHYGLNPNIAFQLMATKTGLTCVANNSGIMITLDRMVLNNASRDKITILSIGEHPLMKELVVMYPQDAIFQEEIRKFIEIAKVSII